MASSSKNIFEVGEVVAGTYEVRSMLGSGGMGQVFEAHDFVLNRRVALKVNWPDLNEPIRKEAQALAAIRHPGMVQVYTVAQHRGLEFIVMERVYGISLDAHLFRRRAAGELTSADEVVTVLSSLCEVLSVVHLAGVAHRDIKPANVMLAPGNRVVLMDFGLFSAEFEVAGQATVVGSPQYMSPEAIVNEVRPGAGHLVDLYALGVLAFEMLCGEVPFGGDDVDLVWQKHMTAPVPDLRRLRPDVPPRLAALVAELMAKDPRERPQSADAVLWQLAAVRTRSQRGATGASKRPLSVLIVDDDPQIVRVLAHYVRRVEPDADVRTAADGEAALSALRERSPDLMLLDLQMPRMNGIEVCMYLRGGEVAERCMIVSVSAGVQEHDQHLLMQLGITRFLQKGPGLGERVAEVVREVSKRVAKA